LPELNGYYFRKYGRRKMKLECASFGTGERIPDIHAKENMNISPALTWCDVPDGTQEFVLLVENPASDMGISVHWLLYNIPPEISGIPGRVSREELIDTLGGATHGLNDYGLYGWDGMTPGYDEPRFYIFRLFALSEALNLNGGLIRPEVLEAMEQKVIETAELMGTYVELQTTSQKNPFKWGRIS